MKKKILSIMLALALCLTLMPMTAFAASPEMQMRADALNSIGLFGGTGVDESYNPVYELDRTPNRYEAVTMLTRLLGKEAEAKAGSWETPFVDVVDWAKPYVGYAYNNGLTSGTSATTFGGAAEINPTQYLTFVLRALGYVSGEDFEWDKAWELTDKLAITTGQYNEKKATFTRGDIVEISYSAMCAEVQKTGKTLFESLKQNGTVSKDAILGCPRYKEMKFQADLDNVEGFSVRSVEAKKVGERYQFKLIFDSSCDRSFQFFKAGATEEADVKFFKLFADKGQVEFSIDSEMVENTKRVVMRFANKGWGDSATGRTIYVDTAQLLELKDYKQTAGLNSNLNMNTKSDEKRIDNNGNKLAELASDFEKAPSLLKWNYFTAVFSDTISSVDRDEIVLYRLDTMKRIQIKDTQSGSTEKNCLLIIPSETYKEGVPYYLYIPTGIVRLSNGTTYDLPIHCQFIP